MGPAEPSRPVSRAGSTGLPGTVKVGGWLHTGQFADQRYDINGGLQAVSGLPPLSIPAISLFTA